MFFNLFKKKAVSAVVDSSSQSVMLSLRMMEKDLSHDQAVIADINVVRVREEAGKPVLYFCNIHPLNIRKVLNPGDGEEIPTELKLHNVKIPRKLFGRHSDRYINIKNVKLYSNGTMQIIANSETKYEPV